MDKVNTGKKLDGWVSFEEYLKMDHDADKI